MPRAHGGLDAAVTQVSLQRAGIRSLVCQRVAAGVAQHVRMNLEGYLGLNASPLDQLGQAGDREWRPALGHEDKGRLGLTLQNPQRPKLVAEQGMRAGCPGLGSAQMQVAGLKLDVGPLE